MDMPTAEHLLRTAERLFAERGLAAVSLRQIATAAGQRNPAVVQYHFGSKDQLVSAIIESRAATIDERRLELLSGPRLTGDDELRRIVRGIVVPLHEFGTGNHYVQFLANLAASPQALVDAYSRIDLRVRLGGRIIEDALDGALAGMPAAVRELRVAMVLRLVLGTLASRDHNGQDDLGDTCFLANVVEAAVGLLTAPVPADSPSAASLRRPSATG